MIIDIAHFDKQIDNINQILLENDFKVFALQKMKFHNFKKDEVQKHYKSTFLNFPLVIENSSEEIGISIFATELLNVYYEFNEHNHGISAKKESEISNNRKKFNPENNLETVEFFIDELLRSLVYNYDDFIKNTMQQHYFVGINEEIKVLANILKRYKSILNDNTKQIDLFWSIRLTKKISDLILEILIEFIEHRLNLLSTSIDNFNFDTQTTFINNEIFGLKWNGSQQELCELILELEKKHWIEKIKNGERRKYASSITKLFDLTNTKKNDNSNSNNSFYQLLKGEFENKIRTFPFLENENYCKSFNEIKKLNKK